MSIIYLIFYVQIVTHEDNILVAEKGTSKLLMIHDSYLYILISDGRVMKLSSGHGLDWIFLQWVQRKMNFIKVAWR